MKTLPIGSISSGTMRPEDLIPDFVWALKDVATREDLRFVREVEKRMEDEEYYSSEDADYDLESLFERLDSHCPPFCYFGAHEGDGADYGVWVSWDAIRDALHDGEIVAHDKIPKGYTGYSIDQNDHGNATLYKVNRGRAREIWGIV